MTDEEQIHQNVDLHTSDITDTKAETPEQDVVAWPRRERSFVLPGMTLEQAEQSVKTMGFILHDLDERYGVPSVRPSYKIAETDKNGTTVQAEVDWIEDAVPFGDFIKETVPFIDPEISTAFDRLAGNLVRNMKDTVQYGAYINHDSLHLMQYVYSPSAAQSRHVLLVDVDPSFTMYVKPIEMSEPTEYANQTDQVLQIYVEQARDILELQRVSSATLSSRELLMEAVLAVPISISERVEAWKQAVVNAIRSNDLVLMRRLEAAFIDDEDPTTASAVN